MKTLEERQMFPFLAGGATSKFRLKIPVKKKTYPPEALFCG
jgi:hypothetical protein